jgi:hypothetical protein
MPELLEQPQIHTLGELLGLMDRQYRVPVFQRDYEWQDDQIDDFTEDFFAAGEQGSEHFFGTLVFSNNAPGPVYDGPDNVRYVIDGQQRIATSLITLAVLRLHFLEIANLMPEQSGDLLLHAMRLGMMTCVGNPAASGLKSRPKLCANRTNQRFLATILSNETSSFGDISEAFGDLPTNERDHSQKMHNAVQRLRVNVVQRIARHNNLNISESTESFKALVNTDSINQVIQHLKKLSTSLLQKALFVEINIRTWEDAFVIFEGLNNRGLELSEKDLIKNGLLARGYSADVHNPDIFSQLEQRWDTLTSRIADAKFARFIRHFLLLTEKEVPLKRVVRILLQHFSGKTAEAMLSELEKAAEAYEKITQPSKEKDKKVRDLLSNLNTLEAERCFPIPLAIKLRKLSVTHEKQILRKVEILYFRRSSIMARDNKAIEDDLREIAALIFAQGARAVPEAVRKIQLLTPDDDEFIEAFCRRRGMKDSIARYMLVEVENHLRGRSITRVSHGSETTLEHILPKKPALWQLSKQEAELHSVIVNRLGNLTILTRERNSEIGNKPFSTKLLKYKKEALLINQDVVKAKKWLSGNIVERQEILAAYAASTWPNGPKVSAGRAGDTRAD